MLDCYKVCEGNNGCARLIISPALIFQNFIVEYQHNQQKKTFSTGKDYENVCNRKDVPNIHKWESIFQNKAFAINKKYDWLLLENIKIEAYNNSGGIKPITGRQILDYLGKAFQINAEKEALKAMQLSPPPETTIGDLILDALNPGQTSLDLDNYTSVTINLYTDPKDKRNCRIYQDLNDFDIPVQELGIMEKNVTIIFHLNTSQTALVEIRAYPEEVSVPRKVHNGMTGLSNFVKGFTKLFWGTAEKKKIEYRFEHQKYIEEYFNQGERMFRIPNPLDLPALPKDPFRRPDEED